MDGKESPVYPHSDLESMSQHTSQNDVVMARTWSPHEDGRPDTAFLTLDVPATCVGDKSTRIVHSGYLSGRTEGAVVHVIG